MNRAREGTRKLTRSAEIRVMSPRIHFSLSLMCGGASSLMVNGVVVKRKGCNALAVLVWV